MQRFVADVAGLLFLRKMGGDLREIADDRAGRRIAPGAASIICLLYTSLVVDRPGVLADVARVLAARQIGISSVIQPEAHAGETTALILMLHDAPESQLQAAIGEISKIGAVKAPPVHLRVEDFEAN